MDEPIRILHVIGRMNRGGAETMIMNLYRNIDKTKVQFDFVEHYYDRAVFDDEIESLGGRIFRCPRYKIKNHFEYKKWWEEFFKNNSTNYVAIHGHIGSTASIYLSIAKKYRLYTIAHSHSTGKIMDFKDLCYDILSYTTRNIADYFFGCSQLAGEKRYGKKVANNKEVFTVLNNAIESDKYVFNENIRKKIRDEFSLTDSHFVIGHIGRFQKVKNHTFLVNIFKEIYEINPNAVLMLVGTGENIEQIKSQVKELNLENNVIFTGVRSDVNELLQAFDVFVFPSIYEGLPVTVVEAQAAGLPCLISDTITKEVSVTNLVNYASLSDSYKGWAEESIRISNKDRKNIKQLIIDAGYDIKTTSKWLENFYLNLK